MARRLALLIGNQRFDDGSGFEPLRRPHNDVDALARVLGDPARGGFDHPVEVLKDASLRTLARSLQQILRTAAPSDKVLIHYSGHGQPDEDGRLFFAAKDSHAEELATTALRASDLQEWMARSAAGSVVLFLDCCFAGAFGKVLTGGLRGAQETSIQQQLRAAAQAASGRFILASATSWQTAQETEDDADGIWMGRFTRAVLGRLAVIAMEVVPAGLSWLAVVAMPTPSNLEPRMDSHENARTTPHGRMLIVERFAEGRSVGHVAAAAGVTAKTVRKWRDRFAAEGAAGLRDRSARPHHSPRRLPAPTEAQIEALRRQRRSSPAIARRLGRAVSTVGLVLRRLGLGRLRALDPRPESSATSASTRAS